MSSKTESQKKTDDEEKKSQTSSRRSKTSRKSSSRKLQVPSTSPHMTDPAAFEARMDPDEPVPASQFVSWRIDRPVALHMAKTGPLAQKPITMMTLLKESSTKHPNKLAYACLIDGHWIKLTYQEFHEMVIQAAHGFLKLGLQRFNGVGILGNNAIEYLIVHLGIIFAGGVSIPLHINTAESYTFDLVKTARCRFIVVDSIEKRMQVLEWRKALPDLKMIIIQYGKESFETKAEDLYTWQQFIESGRDITPDMLTARIIQQAPNLCCCVLQTAGNSGQPKNVMLSHDNLVWGAHTVGRYMSLSNGKGVLFNFMPLSRILSLTVSVSIALQFGASVYLVPATRNKALLLQIMREIHPTILFAPAVFFEHLQRELDMRLISSNIFNRLVKQWAMKIGKKAFDDKTRLTHPPAFWSLANRILFRKVRKRLGLEDCDELVTAGGFMIKSNIDFFLGLDMPLLMGYGLTESSGFHTCCLHERFRINSVGVGLDGCKTQIANPDSNGVGELLVAGRNLAMGYLDSEELTKKYFQEDGTFRTGDLARKDGEGFIYVVGRDCDVVTLSGGEKISTIPISMSVLSNLPFVSHALVVGQGKPYLALLMTIKTELDTDTELPTNRLIARSVVWFRTLGFNVKVVEDIVTKADPKLLDKIQTIIDQINSESPHVAHNIKRWTFLSNDFTTFSDELGPTLKVRRWIVEKKYTVTIDSMYPYESTHSPHMI